MKRNIITIALTIGLIFFAAISLVCFAEAGENGVVCPTGQIKTAGSLQLIPGTSVVQAQTNQETAKNTVSLQQDISNFSIPPLNPAFGIIVLSPTSSIVSPGTTTINNGTSTGTIIVAPNGDITITGTIIVPSINITTLNGGGTSLSTGQTPTSGTITAIQTGLTTTTQTSVISTVQTDVITPVQPITTPLEIGYLGSTNIPLIDGNSVIVTAEKHTVSSIPIKHNILKPFPPPTSGIINLTPVNNQKILPYIPVTAPLRSGYLDPGATFIVNSSVSFVPIVEPKK